MGPSLEEASHSTLLDNELDPTPDQGLAMLLWTKDFHLIVRSNV
jgi:hypothetical protein